MAEWTLLGSVSRGGFVYVHGNGTRAYIHLDDQGDLDVATWDPSGDERAFPDREALEMIVETDVAAMRESDGQERLMLWISGVGDFTTVRSYRGRRKKWDRLRLERFADDVIELGLTEATRRERIGARHGRELMRRAADASLVTVESGSGLRGENVYSRMQVDVIAASPSDRADWHRDRWMDARRLAETYQENWERRSGTVGRDG